MVVPVKLISKDHQNVSTSQQGLTPLSIRTTIVLPSSHSRKNSGTEFADSLNNALEHPAFEPVEKWQAQEPVAGAPAHGTLTGPGSITAAHVGHVER